MADGCGVTPRLYIAIFALTWMSPCDLFLHLRIASSRRHHLASSISHIFYLFFSSFIWVSGISSNRVHTTYRSFGGTRKSYFFLHCNIPTPRVHFTDVPNHRWLGKRLLFILLVFTTAADVLRLSFVPIVCSIHKLAGT